MATLPFRHPQFSDDAAWLPPWLQPNHHSQSHTTSLPSDDDISPLSLQNADLLGGMNHTKESKILLSEGNGRKSFNVCQLYLSGEDSSPITLTPFDEVLHFNLHLSTEGASSIISSRVSDSSQKESVNPTEVKVLSSVVTVRSPRKTIPSNLSNDASDIKSSPPNNTCFGKVVEKSSWKTKNSRSDNLEIYNKLSSECDDVNNAVELSVAASEALVIHEIIQTEPILKAMSTAAILEVALRVKEARIDGLQDSLCCLEDTDNTYDVHSDLSDSDLEDVYNDVGLSIRSVDNISSMDPSVSRVKDTPMTHIHPEGEGEVQSEWNQDMEHFKDSFLARPVENNLGTEKSDDLAYVTIDIDKHEMSYRDTIFDSLPETSCHLGNETLDNLQMNQGENNDRMDIENPADQKLTSSLQLLHSEKQNMNKESDRSSSRYQSRWLGGWGAKESNVPKNLCKMLINEASYLSESIYTAPDQNSVANYLRSCSKSSESNKSNEDSCKTATREALVSQDVVKESNSSFIDPLCSMVPCSISSEIGKSPVAKKNIDNPKLINDANSLNIGAKILPEEVQTSSGQNDENIKRKENTELILGDVCINPIIRQQGKSLKDYSRGLQGNSLPSLGNFSKDGLGEGEANKALLYGIDNNSINTEDLMIPLYVESMPGCLFAKIHEQHENTKLLTMEQHVSCHNTSTKKVPMKQQLLRPMASCTTLTENGKPHCANSVGRLSVDHCKGSDKNQAQVHQRMQEIPRSPLVLGHRTRRFRAPKLLVTDLQKDIQAIDQVQGSENVIHKSVDIPEGQLQSLSNTGISVRKRVRFSDAEIKPCSNKRLKRHVTFRIGRKVVNKLGRIDEEQGITSQEVKEHLTKCCLKGRKRLIFQGLDFLLTGFSKKKEQEIVGLLRKHGGTILSDIPTPLPRPREKERKSFGSYAEKLPVVICSRKLQTAAFLYGCAVNAFLLKVGWAYDSIKAGSVLPPDKYELLCNRNDRMVKQIGKSITQNVVDCLFVKVGIMLHGTHSFCTKLAKVIKHGRGLVYKSLQWLIQSLDKKKISLGAIVIEEENQATRHLKKYASERKIPVMPACWIVNSLFEGKLLPLQEKMSSPQPPAVKAPVVSVLQDWSQEI